MGFLDRWRSRASGNGTVNEVTTDKKAKGQLAKGPLGSSQWRQIGPAAAVGTPLRYDRLAEEGYGRNIIAHRAINLVARGVASIPVQLRDRNGPLKDHPLLTLLQRPNMMTSGTQFIQSLVAQYLIAGNGFCLAVGPKTGTPRELWLLRPDSVRVLAGDGAPSGFRQEVDGRKRDFPAAQVMHWRHFHPTDPWYGLSPLAAAALSLDTHNEGTRWNLALIQNGGTPSGVLYQEGNEAPLTESQFAHLKKQIEERYTGPQNAGRPLLLEGGLRWQDMALSPKDLDWSASKNMAAREIALAFGVPPQLLGIPDSQTYSNYQEARLSVWEDTIIPLAQEMVSQLSGWLLPKFEDGLALTLNLDDIPALEPKRARKFERIQAADFLSRAEKRDLLGFAPETDDLTVRQPKEGDDDPATR